jgi:hypothetical protein
MACSFLAARNTRSNEEKSLRFKFFGAADRIGIMGVSTIDDDITFLQVRLEEFDEVIDRRSSLYQKNDFARFLELRDELLYGMCALDVCTFASRTMRSYLGGSMRQIKPFASFARKASTLDVVRL